MAAHGGGSLDEGVSASAENMDGPGVVCVPSWRLPNGQSWSDTDGDANLPAKYGSQVVDYKGFPGLGLYRPQVRLNETVQFSGRMLSRTPFFVLRLARSGHVGVRLPAAEPVVETQDSYGLFVHATVEEPCLLDHRPGGECDATVVIISQDRLRTMLAGVRVSRPVERMLDDRAENFAATASVTDSIRRLALRFMCNPLKGEFEGLYLTGLLFEATALAMAGLSDCVHNDSRADNREHVKVAAVIDFLWADPTATPNLERVARDVGLTPRRLATLFREKTGKTIFEWVLGQKLDLAARMLVEENRPIKDVAHQLGYAHVPAFNAAFRRRFGVPPAQYRRSIAISHPVILPDA